MTAVHFSLASLPAKSPEDAMNMAVGTQASDPLFGILSLDHVQVCPQNCRSIFDESAAKALKDAYPDTRFRLHANVRVEGRHKPDADLCAFLHYQDYFRQLASVSRVLEAPAYTVHAGVRRRSRWDDLMEHLEALEDWFGIPVGIEGHYPTPRNSYWIQDWAEYRKVLESGRPYALDLSHLNIVAVQSGVYDHVLTREMLASEQCIEVHVSHNNGQNDQHIPMDPNNPPWWMDDLEAAGEQAVIFYEGNLRRQSSQ